VIGYYYKSGAVYGLVQSIPVLPAPARAEEGGEVRAALGGVAAPAAQAGEEPLPGKQGSSGSGGSYFIFLKDSYFIFLKDSYFIFLKDGPY
jgi:hypothetical protein